MCESNRVDGFLLQVLNRIGIPYDESKPLDNPSSVVYAAAVLEVEPLMREARRALAAVEEKLRPYGSSVEECFATVNSTLSAIGFPP